MRTPSVTVRIPPELIAAAQDAHPELAGATVSIVFRYALALAAGIEIESVAKDLHPQRKSGGVIMPGFRPVAA